VLGRRESYFPKICALTRENRPANSTLRYRRPADDHGGSFMVMDMTMMSTGMMVGMVIYHLIIVIFALLGIVAFIKYLRS
jgi:hypothetical protein